MSTTTTPADITITPSYELAEGFYPEAVISALVELFEFACEVDEFIEINPTRLEGTEFADMDGEDEIAWAKTVLAGLLSDGGQLNEQGWLAWIDDEGKELFSFGFEEIKAWADPRSFRRLVEWFPVESGEGLPRDLGDVVFVRV